MEARYTDLAAIQTCQKTESSSIFIIASKHMGMYSTFSHNGHQPRRWFKNDYRQTGQDLFMQHEHDSIYGFKDFYSHRRMTRTNINNFWFVTSFCIRNYKIWNQLARKNSGLFLY